MYSFGKTPPRSLECFGVAGLLGEGCQVFYESIFSTKHLGRVSDLLAARLRAAGLDELRLRAIVLFSAFEVFRNQHRVAAKAGEPAAAEPLVIECGLDGDKVALGVAFTLPETFKIETGGLAERISARQGSGPFERLLQTLHESSDRLVLRYQAGIRRVEVVSLLAIPGKMEPAALATQVPLHVVLLDKNPVAETPKVAAYVELGDLDYPQLLKEDLPGANLPPSPTGEVLMQGLTELEKSLRVRAHAQAQGDDLVKISGTTQNIKDDVIRIKGSGAQVQDQALVRVSGGPGGMPAEVEKEYQQKIEALQKRVAELEGGKTDAGDEDAGDDDAGDGDSGGTALAEELNARKEQVKGLFKKVWPFKKKSEDEDEAATEAEGSEGDAPAAADAKAADAKAADTKAAKDAKGSEPKPAASDKAAPAKEPEGEELPPPPAASAQGGANPEAAANSLMVEIQNGSLDRTIVNAQKEMADIKKDLGSGKAKRWVDGLMSELVQEKARLSEFAKKLNTQIRQKELEFRNREQGLLEELRRRDDLLRQKNSALNRTKEQLSQVQITMERVKQQSHAAGDDAHYKQKYNFSQKVLTTVKEENEKLTEKVEELKNQVAAAQINSVKSRGPGVQEFAAIQAKYERAVRQAEEFKRANADLMNRLAEAGGNKKAPAAGEAAELKKRLEAAMKLATASQKETEQIRLRVDELQREETRLKMELNRANGELRTLKQKGQGPSGGAGEGSTPPKAA